MTALDVRDLEKSFGGLRVTGGGEPHRRAGRAPLDHRAERRREDHALQPHHRRAQARPAARSRCSTATSRAFRDGGARISASPAPIRSSPSSPDETLLRNVTLSLLGLRRLRWNPFVRLGRQQALIAEARAALDRVGLGHLADRPLAQTSYGERRRVEIAMALAQRPRVLLLDEPFAGLSIEERRDVLRLVGAIPRDVTIVMIEHDMDVALDFAERITVLHFGEVVVEGSRAEVVAHPRTREIYLGD